MYGLSVYEEINRDESGRNEINETERKTKQNE